MNNKEIDKIIKLVKDGKIIISNGSLEINQKFIKKANMRKNSSSNDEISSKSSDKICFHIDQSGKLILTGSKETAIRLNNKLKHIIALPSITKIRNGINEEKIAVYKAISNMLETYILNLDKAPVKKPQKIYIELQTNNKKTDIEITNKKLETIDTEAAYSEVKTVATKSDYNEAETIATKSDYNEAETIDTKSDYDETETVDIEGAYSETETIDNDSDYNETETTDGEYYYDETDTIDIKSLYDTEKLYVGYEKTIAFEEAFNCLPDKEQNQLLKIYLKTKNTSFSFLKLKFNKSSVVSKFFEDLLDDDYSGLKHDLYAECCNILNAKKDKSRTITSIKNDYYNGLTQKQRYLMKQYYSKINKRKGPIFMRPIFSFPRIIPDANIIHDIVEDNYGAYGFFSQLLAKNQEQKSKQHTSHQTSTPPAFRKRMVAETDISNTHRSYNNSRLSEQKNSHVTGEQDEEPEQ